MRTTFERTRLSDGAAVGQMSRKQPIQSGPLSGPLLITGYLVTLYFCLIVLTVRRPLLGTKFITYFVYNQIFIDKDVIFIHLMGSAFSAVTDRDCRLCRARSSENCNAFFKISSEAKNSSENMFLS